MFDCFPFSKTPTPDSNARKDNFIRFTEASRHRKILMATQTRALYSAIYVSTSIASLFAFYADISKHQPPIDTIETLRENCELVCLDSLSRKISLSMFILIRRVISVQFLLLYASHFRNKGNPRLIVLHGEDGSRR